MSWCIQRLSQHLSVRALLVRWSTAAGVYTCEEALWPEGSCVARAFCRLQLTTEVLERASDGERKGGTNWLFSSLYHFQRKDFNVHFFSCRTTRRCCLHSQSCTDALKCVRCGVVFANETNTNDDPTRTSSAVSLSRNRPFPMIRAEPFKDRLFYAFPTLA